ncbi:MAG: CocE/NonD family hydrolase [Bacillota bacterium]
MRRPLLDIEVRGRYASEGEWLPYKTEASDGHDTVRWLRDQPWCNGKIALLGGSYGAFAAFAAAQADHAEQIAGLVTLVPAMGLEQTAFHSSGVFHLSDQLWWHASFGSSRFSREEELRQTLRREPRLYAHLPVRDLNRVFAMPLASWERIFAHGQAAVERVDLGRIRQPVLHIGGWHDPFVASTLENYRFLRAHAAGQQALVVGPWGHNVNTETRCGDRDYGPAALIPLGALERSWLESCMDGAPFRFPAVLVFVMGANVWTAPPSWPVPDQWREDWYLHAGGALSQSPPDPEPADQYLYNPLRPAPSLEEPLDRSRLASRSDLLTYTSPPLAEDLLVAGSPTLTLSVSSSAPVTDFFGYLSEVTPDGAFYVSHGLIRLQAADGRSIDRVEASFPLRPVCQLFRRGHRLRIEITSSSFPRYARSLNVPGDSHTATDVQTALQTVWHEPGLVSRVTLPIQNDMVRRWRYEFGT